jgi:Tol biopolymer transport system component
VNGPTFDGGPSISTSGLVLYFTSDSRPGGLGRADIWVTTRASTSDPFGPPANVGPPVNEPGFDAASEISADDLTLYLGSDRPGAFGAFCNIWAVSRTTPTQAFANAVDLGPAVNRGTCNDHPTVSADGLTLVFSSDGSAGPDDKDLWISTRATTSAPFGPAKNLGPTVNGPGYDSEPSIAADGLTLYFASYRAGGIGDKDIWVTTRPTTSAEFRAPKNLGRPVNSRYEDGTPDISSDGSTLFFHSFRPGGPGGGDLWSARKKG